MSDQTTAVSYAGSSSSLYRSAAGVDAIGTPLAHASTCAMCGARLPPGALGNLIKADTFGDSFNNKVDIKYAGTVVCGDCEALWKPAFLQKYSKTYANADGVFKFASNQDVAAFVFRPPTAPFVAIYSTRQQQHLTWRTPVSYSSENMVMRADDELMRINRPLVVEAVRAWRYAVERMKAIGMKGVPAWLAMDMKSSRMGSLRPDVAAAVAAESEQGAQAIKTLQSLRMGEWWALCSARHYDPDAPQTWPQRIQVLPLSAISQNADAVSAED